MLDYIITNYGKKGDWFLRPIRLFIDSSSGVMFCLTVWSPAKDSLTKDSLTSLVKNRQSLVRDFGVWEPDYIWKSALYWTWENSSLARNTYHPICLLDHTLTLRLDSYTQRPTPFMLLVYVWLWTMNDCSIMHKQGQGLTLHCLVLCWLWMIV